MLPETNSPETADLLTKRTRIAIKAKKRNYVSVTRLMAMGLRVLSGLSSLLINFIAIKRYSHRIYSTSRVRDG